MEPSCAFRSLQIWTPDFEASFTFYSDIVGMKPVHRDGNAFAIMKLGDFRLDLDTDDDERRKNRGLFEQLHAAARGLGFYLTFSVPDVQTQFMVVREAGYPVVAPQWGEPIEEPVEMPWGGRQFGTTDPAGYHIVFSQS